MINYDGKVVIVTGGTRGIGLETKEDSIDPFQSFLCHVTNTIASTFQKMLWRKKV